MEETIAQFLEYLQREKAFSANTVAAYKNDLLQLAAYLKDESKNGSWDWPTEWSMIQARYIQSYVGDLRSKSYSQATVARKIASVKSFFHFLQEQKLIASDPTEGLSSPGVRRALPKTIPSWEMTELLEQPLRKDSPEARRDWAMLSLLCATGMRVTELIKLNVEDLVLDSNYPYVRCLGRGAKPRLIPLGPHVLTVLHDNMTTPRDRFVRRSTETALFLNRRGERLTRQGFWLILKGYAKAANIRSDITPHILRHTFATMMLQSGKLNLRELQECLGHASITTTQVYTQLPQASVRGS
jgi:integrase/recombinase XerD